MNYSELETQTVDQLRALARERGLADVSGLRKAALITRIIYGLSGGGERLDPGAGSGAVEEKASISETPNGGMPVAGDSEPSNIAPSSRDVEARPRTRTTAGRRDGATRVPAKTGADEAKAADGGPATLSELVATAPQAPAVLAPSIPAVQALIDAATPQSAEMPEATAPGITPNAAIPPQVGWERPVATEPSDLSPRTVVPPGGRREPRNPSARDRLMIGPAEPEARLQASASTSRDREFVGGPVQAAHDGSAEAPEQAPVAPPASAVDTQNGALVSRSEPNGVDGIRPVDDRASLSGGRPNGAPMAPGTPAVRPFERQRGRDRERGRGGFERYERGDRGEGATGSRAQGTPGDPGKSAAYGYQAQPAPTRQGVLEIMDEGWGFLRLDRHWMPGHDDIYVAQAQIRRFGLRTGDVIVGQMRSPKDSEKYASLLRIETVNGQDPETAKRRPVFDSLTALFPNRMFDLEMTEIQGMRELQQANLSNRVINLLSPIGRGQRGLIVSPPKAGKTMLLKGIAHAITRNQPDAYVMVALIGERPEEVTDWQKTVPGAEVISSTFDEPPENHTRVAEMCLERAKRVAELGKDVIILLDSITRLARAYNQCVPASGRTLSGGMDPAALFPPKRFFGAARNLEEGGSLTIVATCLVETESRLDDLIYEEFKGTGNMELRLDRKLQEKRIFPAINVQASSTRRDDLLLGEAVLRQAVMLRRIIASVGTTEAVERMIETMGKTETNREFLQAMSKVPA